MTVGKLRRLYKTALRLEVAFFEAQHVAAAYPRIGMLVTDFDDTCTASDTISTIIQTATEAKAKAAEASGGRLQEFGCSSLPCKTVADIDDAHGIFGKHAVAPLQLLADRRTWRKPAARLDAVAIKSS